MKVFLLFFFVSAFCTTLKSQKVTEKWDVSMDAGILTNTSVDYIMPYLTLSRSYSFNSNWNAYAGVMLAETGISDTHLGSWTTGNNAYKASIDRWTPSLYLRVATTHKFPVARTWGFYTGGNVWVSPFPLADIDIEKTDLTTHKTTQKTCWKWCFATPGATLQAGVYLGGDLDYKLYLGVEYGYFDRYSQKKRISTGGKRMNVFFRGYQSRVMAISVRVAL
ncbi:MAG: hypothetical protein LBG18_04230 [Mediterranea sp.]|jgi:hypothetical protein|nr:hypothetical protein [Mediterranea sp.]